MKSLFLVRGKNMKCYICATEGRDTNAVGTCDNCKKNICEEHLYTCNSCGKRFCENHINFTYREERNDCCIWPVIDGILCDQCWTPPNERTIC